MGLNLLIDLMLRLMMIACLRLILILKLLLRGIRRCILDHRLFSYSSLSLYRLLIVIFGMRV